MLLGQVVEARCTQVVNPKYTNICKVAKSVLAAMPDPSAMGDDPASASLAAVRTAFLTGALTPRDYADALCARAAACSELAIWAHFDADAFLAAAEAGPASGPLAGVPVAVKDIFDTADMPTEAGSPLWAGRRPMRDAACVAAMRAAGAVVMGKTVTTEFAFAHPGPTRNPYDPSRTPGGSSSGSAAAVAAGVAPLAIGSQTAGSIVRPAAFCGVVGYKPSFGRINRSGCLSFSESLDTVGVFARTVSDAWLLAEVLAGSARPTLPAPLRRLPRIGLCRTPQWERAAPESRAAFAAAASAIERAGGTVVPLEVGPPHQDLQTVHLQVMAYEAARALAPEWRTGRAGLSDKLAALVEEGRSIDVEVHRRNLASAAVARAAWAADLVDLDAALTPSAVGQAPAGLDSTGDAVFNRVWTLLRGPCLNLPAGRGPDGLPIGVQLVGKRWDDQSFIGTACWVETALQQAFGR